MEFLVEFLEQISKELSRDFLLIIDAEEIIEEMVQKSLEGFLEYINYSKIKTEGWYNFSEIS